MNEHCLLLYEAKRNMLAKVAPGRQPGCSEPLCPSQISSVSPDSLSAVCSRPQASQHRQIFAC